MNFKECPFTKLMELSSLDADEHCCRAFFIIFHNCFFAQVSRKFNLISFHDSGAEWKLLRGLRVWWEWIIWRSLDGYSIDDNRIYTATFLNWSWFSILQRCITNTFTISLWFLSNFNIYWKCFRIQLLVRREAMFIDMLNWMPIWIQIIVGKRLLPCHGVR